jgi:hypothetical protein
MPPTSRTEGDEPRGLTTWRSVFVLLAMLDGHPHWRRRVLLNLGGLLDFVDAIATGVVTSNNSLGVFALATPMPLMGMMPLSLIPSVLVPLRIITHCASLLQLRTRGSAVRGS